MLREVQPELLDELPADHPEVRRNRRDLRIINAWMRNFSWFASSLAAYRVLDGRGAALEIGAGDGALGAFLHRRFGPTGLPRLHGIDRCGRPPAWPEAWPWSTADLLEHPFDETCPVVLGNMILHQFRDEGLRSLGAHFDRTAEWLLFCEPARRKRHLHQLKLGVLINFCETTWHDAAVSIRAGFLGFELPRLLRLDPSRWEWRCTLTFFGGYRMLAWRK